MTIFRTHRKGATAFALLTLAAAVPGPVQGEVAMAEVAAPIAFDPIPSTLAAPVEEDAAPADAPAALIGEGVASFYGAELAGNRTASGERFDPAALTAAHRTLPMGTRLKVTNTANGRSVVVRVNDRGPFARSRILDVSRAAAERIAMVRTGTARVTLERLG